MVTSDIKTIDRTDWITQLYLGVFPTVAGFVGKAGGGLEDAKDIFHDSLIIYYEKFRDKPEAIENEKAYILGIVKHLWLKRHSELKVSERFDTEFHTLEEENATTYSTHKLLAFLENTSKKCMELLEAFYYKKLPMTKLANAFGFAGERSATVQKFKCLEKVRNQVKEKGLSYEDFAE